MTKLTEKMKLMQALLSELTPDCFHYVADGETKPCPYIVWQESTEQDPVDGDNRKTEQVIQFDIELYVLDEFDPIIDAVQDLMDTNCLSWTYDGSDLELDTRVVHHSWRCEF